MRQTTIVNNIVSPRYYHIWEDNIESKGVMEAIGTSVGIGPVIGFDIVDTTKSYLSITGITNPNINVDFIAPKQSLVKGATKYLKISNKANQAGFVVNSHITPDGLLSIDPAVIDIPSMAIDWTSINNGTSCKVIALIARHVYEEIEDEEGVIYPTVSNFRAVDLTLYYTENLLTKPLAAHWSTQSGAMTFAMQVANGFNRSTEVLIGLYILGDTQYLTNNEWFYTTYGRVFPLVNYNSVWPQYNNIGDRYINKLFENLYYQLPVSSKELNWAHIYASKAALDSDPPVPMSTDSIWFDRSHNIPPGLVLNEIEYNLGFIIDDVTCYRIAFELMIPSSATEFSNILESTLQFEVESSNVQDISSTEVLRVIHKSCAKLYNSLSRITYIQCDCFIKQGTLTNNNKFPKFKISFASL